MVRFRTLVQKKTTLAVDLLAIAAPPNSQVPLPTIDLILAMDDAVIGIGPSSSKAPLLDKHKEKGLTVGPSKRPKKKIGEASLAFLPSSGANAKLWKPEFSTVELGK